MEIGTSIASQSITAQCSSLCACQIRPFGSLELLLQPDVFLLMFFSSLPYAVFYCVLTATSSLFKSKYGLSEVLIGCTYLGNGAGCLIGSMAIGRILDYDYQQFKKTLPADTPLVDFPLEKARFKRLPWIFLVFAASSIGFGWAVNAGTNLAAPIACTFFVGLGSTALMSIVSTMSVDLQPYVLPPAFECAQLIKLFLICAEGEEVPSRRASTSFGACLEL